MKKYLTLLFIALAVLAFVGCDGALHNAGATKLRLSLVSFPLADGNYSWVGDFDSKAWANNDRLIAVAGGAGTYENADECVMKDTNFNFSIVTPGTWDRPWTASTISWTNPADWTEDTKQENDTFRLVVPFNGLINRITVNGSTAQATYAITQE